MSVDNIVALPGYQVPQIDREPVADVVKILEQLLEEARSGELVGIAFATVRAKFGTEAAALSAGAGWEHGHGAKHALITAIAVLDFRTKQSLNED